MSRRTPRRPDPQPLSYMPRRHAFGMFSPSEIEAELIALRRAIGADAKAPAPDMDELDWSEFIERILSRLGPLPDTENVARALQSETDLDRAALAFQLRRALSAVRYARQSDLTCLLLPLSYAERVEMLLGRAHLPMAWISVLDVLQFQ